MANPKHLERLKQGIGAWNQWRKEAPEEKPNLSSADLSRANLAGANFYATDLFKADLSNSFITGADFRRANLNRAYLVGSNLSRAYLMGASLNSADLRSAELTDSNLSNVDLKNANLSKANLSKANLFRADLSNANLKNANLNRVNLVRADLFKADLSNADLFGADLRSAKLIESNLIGADLSNINLVEANLFRADISGSHLYGTARNDWNIQGICCDYLFWDKEGKIRTPKERNFKPGEFEQIYASLPTIEYFFENGMTPLDLVVMDRVVESIKKERPELELQIASVNARGMDQSVKLTIKSPEYSDNALELLTVKYETKIKELEGERNRLYGLIELKMDQPDKINLIDAQPGSFVANDGSSINIEQYVNHLENIERDIKEAPQEKLSDTVKRTALDIVGEALKDVAKGQVKEAAKQIVKLGKDIVPFIIDTAAYGFFKGLLG